MEQEKKEVEEIEEKRRTRKAKKRKPKKESQGRANIDKLFDNLNLQGFKYIFRSLKKLFGFRFDS